MANIFKAKTLLGRTGIFSHEAIAPNLVFNTGNQTINGDKNFTQRLIAPTGFFGLNNTLSGLWAGIGAGNDNFISGDYSFIGGGQSNRMTGDWTVIGGGWANVASGNYLSIGGGYSNRAISSFNFIGGGERNCTSAIHSSVVGGSGNLALCRYSTVVGGCFNRAGGDFSFVGGGHTNSASSCRAAIGGGSCNVASGPYSTVGGGLLNSATAFFSTVDGGRNNQATAAYSNVGGGQNNRATAAYSNVGGGYLNSATGCFSTVGGGERNYILSNANHSYIIGGRCSVVQANHSGAAVFGDGQNRAHLSSGEHTLTLDFASGIYFAQLNIFGNVNFNQGARISGNSILTGIDLSSYATTANSVLIYGNQTIGGNKTFTGITTFSGQEVNLIDTALNLSGAGDMTFTSTNINFISSPVFISGTDLRVTGNVFANNLNNIVYTTGNQTISGIKTFANNLIYPVSPRTSGTNFTPNADLYTFFDFVLTGNSTLNEPTNMVNGESITIFLNQDADGSRSMSFNSNYLFSNGITPTLNFVPSGVDIMQVIRINNKYFTSFAANY